MKSRLPPIPDAFRPGHLIGHGAQLAALRLQAHVEAHQSSVEPKVTRQMARHLLRLEAKAAKRAPAPPPRRTANEM